jgi:hypothetical protein
MDPDEAFVTTANGWMTIAGQAVGGSLGALISVVVT